MSLTPSLPIELRDLVPLAYNLRWSWHAPTRALFRSADPALWEATGHNPVRLLAELPAERIAALAQDAAFVAAVASEAAGLRAYLRGPGLWRARGDDLPEAFAVAYFSAEFAITECLPVFAGGLGVLAGDHLKAASDLGLPLVAVGLLYRDGYFRQRIGADGRQHAHYTSFDPAQLPVTAELTPERSPLMVSLPFLDHQLHARIWRADVGRVPLYLLDSDVAENHQDERRISDRLYGGDHEHRLRQEVLLGIGGMRALPALGLRPAVIHLNEGHAAFAAVERVRQRIGERHGAFRATAEEMAAGVVFTTHTPVPAGHDQFNVALLERYLGGYVWEMREPWERFVALGRRTAAADEPFCMTTLSLRLSHRRNGVSKLHGEVSRAMWQALWPNVPAADVPIQHVTNGVHLASWTAESMAALYARHIGDGWADASDELHWHRASHIPPDELWAARSEQRSALVDDVRVRLAEQVARRGQDAGWAAAALDPDTLTIVFARRFATYKRAALLLGQPERLRKLLLSGRVQFVFAGKAHPRDVPGQEMLKQVFTFANDAAVRGRLVFLEGYDVALARTLVAGADVWLNVPRRPHEASGTSGMKAAANGALNLSIPDGWWAEAWNEHNRLADPIGWTIEATAATEAEQDRADADALFALLESEVVPLFHARDGDLPLKWIDRVRASLRQVVPFFNTHRMVGEYAERVYLPAFGEVALQRVQEAARVEEAG